MNVICITDNTYETVKHYQLTDPVWTFEKLREEFVKINKVHSNRWIRETGYFYWVGCNWDFRNFIIERGAVEIEIETFDISSYPD